jgi:hypothetical protein
MNTKYQRKVLKSLSKLLNNEAPYLRRHAILSKICSVIGGFIIGLSFFSAWHTNDSANIWFVSLGTLGGLLFGLSVFFATSVQQWPVIRKFIDEKAIHEAARNEEL